MKNSTKTPEELAERNRRRAALLEKIRMGEKELLEELWTDMQPVCAWCCKRILKQFPSSFKLELSDLLQCGYIALRDAVEHTKPDMDASGFARFYMFYLTNTIYRENGLAKGGREKDGRRRFDPCISANTRSLDAPLDESEEDRRDLSAFIEDDSAARSIDGIIQNIFLRQLHDSLEILIAKLPQDEQAVIRLLYYIGGPYKDVARSLKISTNKTRKIEDSALIHLREYGTEIGLEQFLETGGVRTPSGGSSDRIAELKEKYKRALSAGNEGQT